MRYKWQMPFKLFVLHSRNWMQVTTPMQQTEPISSTCQLQRIWLCVVLSGSLLHAWSPGQATMNLCIPGRQSAPAVMLVQSLFHAMNWSHPHHTR